MTPEKLDDILKRYEQDQCTAEEQAFVEGWYANLGKGAHDALPNDGQQAMRARLRHKLEAHIEPAEVTPGRARTGVLRWSLRMAAGLVLLAATYFILRGTGDVVQTERVAQVPAVKLLAFTNTMGAPAKVMLSDGSIVTLLPQSEIKYPAAFGALREVYLSGLAFFEVKRDEQHPFLVYTHDVTTRVLGTSFLVAADPDAGHTTVAVKTGRVAVFKPAPHGVTPQTGHEVILTPNQKAVYSKHNDALVAQAVEHPASMVLPPAQKVRYEAAPVTRVLEDLGKSYGVEIRYDAADLADYTLTTTLSAESFDNRIGIICKAIGATYEEHGGVISVIVPERPQTESPQP